jgi:hypothetical protein
MEECPVANCPMTVAETITVDARGLLIDFAVCARHFEQIQRGDFLAQSSDPTRGLVGLGPNSDDS